MLVSSNQESVQPIRVAIADPDLFVRRVLVSVVNADPELQVCGQATSTEEALQELAETDPQVVITDFSLDGAHEFELVRDLRAQYRKVRVVIFSMHDEQLYAEKAIRAGAGGYVMKSESTDHLLRAVCAVMRGEIYLSRTMTSVLLDKLISKNGEKPLHFAIDDLTDREMEVFRLAGSGETTAQIASQLGLKRKMVNVYQRRVRRKLDLHSTTELRQFATQWVMASNHIH